MDTALSVISLAVALVAIAYAKSASTKARATLATLVELIDLVEGMTPMPETADETDDGRVRDPEKGLELAATDPPGVQPAQVALSQPPAAAVSGDTIAELGRKGTPLVEICRKLSVSRREVGLALALAQVKQGGTLDD